MKTRSGVERLSYTLVAGILLSALIAMVWAFALNERQSRQVLLEFEAHQIITSLTELVRLGPLAREDTRNVLAFGLYAEDGSSLYLFGNAAPKLTVTERARNWNRLTILDDRLVLSRMLGGELGARRGMGMMPSQRQRGQSSGEALPSFAYLEYGLGGYKKAQSLALMLASAASIVLIALYALILRLYTRYATYREEEARTRELIELGEAARTIAHEIKNPLGVIRIQCGVIRKKAGSEVGEGLSIIEDELARMVAMTDRIRAFLKNSYGQPADISARAFLAGVFSRYGELVDFSSDLDEGAEFKIDGDRLKEALDNMLSNAFEASEKSGTKERPMVRIYENKKNIMIEIADRGPGVALEMRSRLYEPFFTTKERGTGLGLALAKKTLASLDGSIEYQDRPGGGALFIIKLQKSR
ncbi:MAG TPA: hypothetical protein DCG47_06115 [Spirochaetaceae bacterium]|jgi:signal transduction histidine kinase|nr:hypothetical protein [Spirochaetaceae bacterium]